MKIAAIIAEYNPFHNGHAYHIEETRKITGADCVVVIMSGDFVQRGAPAILDKYTRARSALLHGADLVIELPSYLSTASAEIFAEGSVRLLNSLNCVDYLSFGSECGDISLLQSLADLLTEESPVYQMRLRNHLKAGHSFAKARSLSLAEEVHTEAAEILESPNNILGIEYLKALKRSHSSIQPVTIPRKGNGYHDTEANEFSSATALRSHWSQGDFSMLGVPSESIPLYEASFQDNGILTENDFTVLLNRALYSAEDFTDILDVSREISDRIIKNRNQFYPFTDWVRILKTKQYSYTRISRCLIHILLNIKKEDFHLWKSSENEPYIRILGLRRLSPITEALRNVQIPVITNTKQSDQLDEKALAIFQKELKARDLYRLALYQKNQMTLPDEYHAGPIYL